MQEPGVGGGSEDGIEDAVPAVKWIWYPFNLWDDGHQYSPLEFGIMAPGAPYQRCDDGNQSHRIFLANKIRGKISRSRYHNISVRRGSGAETVRVI